jgi:hypothetical protein
MNPATSATSARTRPLSFTHVRHAPRRPMSLRVALLAQQGEFGEEPAPTDVMVYRQPASDVPVPSAWRAPRPAPTDPSQPLADESDDKQGDTGRARAAPLSPAFDSSLVVYEAMSAEARLYVWLCSGAVTCTLAAWVALA